MLLWVLILIRFCRSQTGSPFVSTTDLLEWDLKAATAANAREAAVLRAVLFGRLADWANQKSVNADLTALQLKKLETRVDAASPLPTSAPPSVREPKKKKKKRTENKTKQNKKKKNTKKKKTKKQQKQKNNPKKKTQKTTTKKQHNNRKKTTTKTNQKKKQKKKNNNNKNNKKCKRTKTKMKNKTYFHCFVWFWFGLVWFRALADFVSNHFFNDSCRLQMHQRLQKQEAQSLRRQVRIFRFFLLFFVCCSFFCFAAFFFGRFIVVVVFQFSV